MDIWIAFIVGAYLLGSVPVSYLVAKRYQEIDLRKYGTNQVGAGNLWRMTSWRIGILVGIFDVCKGLVMVWGAQLAGLDVYQQLVVGLAAVVGHNWPVFLRFHGGRGIGTVIGIVLILPLINDLAMWWSVSFWSILVICTLILRSSPVPVFFAVLSLPLVSWFYEPLSVTLGFLALLLIIVIKRLTAQRSVPPVSVSKGKLLFKRLLFDRDISDRKAWMYRAPDEAGSTEQPPEQQEPREG